MNYREIFKTCPQCGGKNFDEGQPYCVHCLDCTFTACMHADEEIKEIIENYKKRSDKKPKN